MKHILRLLVIPAVILTSFACSEERKENLVDTGQIQSDGSNDYRYIFKDHIEKDKDQRMKFKKDEFRK